MIREVEFEGRKYFVQRFPTNDSWAVTIRAMYLSAYRSTDGGHGYRFPFDREFAPESVRADLASIVRPQHERGVCALVAWDREVRKQMLRVAEIAYPDDFARGEKPLTIDGFPQGVVTVEEMPDVVAKALAEYGISPMNSMAAAATIMDAWFSHRRTIDEDGDGWRFERLLAHALKISNVPAQLKWATWIADPEMAVSDEIANMESK